MGLVKFTRHVLSGKKKKKRELLININELLFFHFKRKKNISALMSHVQRCHKLFINPV